ncbi:MAG: EAL domain-containing protein [Methylophilaceae bacterium]|nr:EAL domain-containing protein [Methylophilaceae bacterium]
MKKIALLNRLLRPLLLIGAMAVLTAAFYMFNQNVEAIKTDALDEMQKLEQAAVSDFKKISQSIQHSKKLGIRFSLDHFGTGYASLIHLRQLPVDTIKIDRALTHNMMNNPIDLALITAVIQLSQELNQQVIAQGAQTNKHLRLLKNLNCHTAQGDGIAKPMPANQVSNWLSANNPFRF